MKGKLAFLALLSTIVTVGGVYATWTFTASSDVADATKEFTVALVPEPNIIGTYGTYHIDTSSVKLAIDQAGEGDHTAVLKIDETSKVVITFTPAANAPVSVKENGVESTFSLSTSKEFTYEGRSVFTLRNHTANAIEWDKDEETGAFTYVIDAAALDAMIDLNTFLLDTLAKYQAFNQAILGTFVISVSDGVVSGSEIGS